MLNRLQLINSPTDSFVDYFLDSKPYHTKLLEIIETYTFIENMAVTFDETVEKDILIENDPLCKQTGFGVDYDDECGYDAIDCCDLFDCFGGYGFIFDNSDELLNLEVTHYQVENTDLSVLSSNDNTGMESFVEVEGNRLTDLRIPIKRIDSNDTLTFSGNLQGIFDTHSIFIIINVQQFEIVDNDIDKVFISGNHVEFFSPKKSFFVLNEDGLRNKKYFYYAASYDAATDQTVLHLSIEIDANILENTSLQIRNSNNNIMTSNGDVGIYKTISNSYDSIQNETIVNLEPGSLSQKPEGDYSLGSVQLRTALKSSRYIELENEDTEEKEESRILYSEYYPETNRTRVFTSSSLDILNDAVNVRLRTHGYFFTSGFDGDEECTDPKAENIHTGLYESLFIEQLDISVEYCTDIECPEEYCTDIECPEEYCTNIECPKEYCTNIECPKEYCVDIECS